MSLVDKIFRLSPSDEQRMIRDVFVHHHLHAGNRGFQSDDDDDEEWDDHDDDDDD